MKLNLGRINFVFCKFVRYVLNGQSDLKGLYCVMLLVLL